jgi:hypothetical protein
VFSVRSLPRCYKRDNYLVSMNRVELSEVKIWFLSEKIRGLLRVSRCELLEAGS